MNKLTNALFTFFVLMLSLFLLNCEESDEDTAPIDETPSKHYLTFELNSSVCSSVTVSVEGEGSKELTSSGSVQWELDPGNYAYTASCDQAYWGETINLIDNNAVVVYLE